MCYCAASKLRAFTTKLLLKTAAEVLCIVLRLIDEIKKMLTRRFQSTTIEKLFTIDATECEPFKSITYIIIADTFID